MSTGTTQSSPMLVIGESLVDVVENNGMRSAHPGGSPMNVAYGLARLDIPTAFATEYGDDEYGRLLAAHLDSAGVEVLRQTSPQGTSVATARIGPDGAAHYEFALRWELDCSSLPAPAMLHIGSIGALREPGGSAVRQFVEGLPDETVVFFDPNVRPALIPEASRSRELVAWYAEHAHVVKLSDEDASWLFPDREPDSVLEWMLERGVKVAAMTLGAHGSILRTRTDRVELPAWPTTVVDTIGAGDAYMAGLIAGAIQVVEPLELRSGTISDYRLRSVGTFAAAAAALTVARAGAMPPKLAEVKHAVREQSARTARDVSPARSSLHLH